MPAVTSASQALANVRVVGVAAFGRLVRRVGQKFLPLCALAIPFRMYAQNERIVAVNSMIQSSTALVGRESLIN